jgi:hypothetical protein
MISNTRLQVGATPVMSLDGQARPGRARARGGLSPTVHSESDPRPLAAESAA